MEGMGRGTARGMDGCMDSVIGGSTSAGVSKLMGSWSLWFWHVWMRV